jgi:TonB family protein
LTERKTPEFETFFGTLTVLTSWQKSGKYFPIINLQKRESVQLHGTGIALTHVGLSLRLGGTVSLRKLKHWTCLGLLAVAFVFVIAPRPAFGDEEGSRKVKTRVSPVYPDLAKRMKIAGTVKVEVVIAANGNVKSTKVIGGHPLLVETSVEAVKKWKYEPSGGDTVETVEFKFSGND